MCGDEGGVEGGGVEMCYDVYEEMGWNLVGIEEEDLLCCDFVWVTWISGFVAVCVVEAALDIRVVS